MKRIFVRRRARHFRLLHARQLRGRATSAPHMPFANAQQSGPMLLVVPAHQHATHGYMAVLDRRLVSQRLALFPLRTLLTA